MLVGPWERSAATVTAMPAADDVRAIATLKARYFRSVDTQDWDALRALFADEVRIDVSGDGAGVTTDPDAFVANVRRALADAHSVHHGHMPEIELTSDRTATGIWAMEDQIWFPPGGPVSHLHGFGHYHETYVKGDDGWRISTMRLTRLRRLVDGTPT